MSFCPRQLAERLDCQPLDIEVVPQTRASIANTSGFNNFPMQVCFKVESLTCLTRSEDASDEQGHLQNPKYSRWASHAHPEIVNS